MKRELFLILDNIRSAYNVGAIFRTADTAGVSKIFLVGVTPDPVDRFGRDRKDISKVALGAEKILLWEHAQSSLTLITRFKKQGFKIVALEQSPDSIDYKKFKTKFPMALILGEEVNGLEKEILKTCDSIIEIPMMGAKESLNVSVAAGVALFRVLGI